MNTIRMPRRRELALAVAVGVTLTACGGGGGGSRPSYNVPAIVTPPPPPPPPTPPAPPTFSVPADVQISGTNTQPAHDAGAKGGGVTIAIVDSGVTTTNPALTGKVTKSLVYVDPAVNNVAVEDVVGHGTVVAELAAGTATGYFAGGVAPSASLVSARIIADKAPADDGSGQGNKVTSADPLGTINADVIAAGASIVNNSWGGLYWDASDTATTASFSAAYASARVGVLYVFAAGNDGKANPSDLAALPARSPSLEPGWLAVVALDSNHLDTIASYSNHCGIAIKYCLAAPGSIVALAPTATATNLSYVEGSGTSFAAPQVSGAAAVVKGVFPSLSTDAVRQIILGTADDLGAPGPDPVFGYGRLNLGKAILGPGRVDWGELPVDLNQNVVTFSNPVAGEGGFNVEGPGTLVLSSSANTFTGNSTIGNGATLDSTGFFPGDATILSTGMLLARGNIGGKVTNEGMLQTTAAGTRIGGDFVQGPTGQLRQVLGAPLIVEGDATLDGDFHVSGVTDGYVKTSHQEVLQAATVTGTFASLSTDPSVFLSTSLQYTPTDVWIDTSTITVVKVASATMSRSAAAVSSAARLDGAFGQLDQALSSPVSAAGVAQGTLLAAGGIQQSRDTQTAQASLESLSGQLYAAGTAVTLAGIDAGNDALMSHLDQNGSGSWSQSLGYQGGLSRAGFGNVGFNLGGGLVGHDIRLGSNGFAGVAVAQMNSNGQLNGNFDRQRSHATQGMFYAGSRGEKWYGVGQVGYGSFRGDMQRVLRLGDQATFAGTDLNGTYDSAYGEVGFRTNAGAFTLTPFANVQYASIRRDGFQEYGGDGFGLAADGHTTSRWQAGFGLRAGGSWLTSMGKLQLNAKLGWQNAFATKGEVFAARYTGFAQWAPVEGIGLSRRAGTAGLNLSLDMSQQTQLGFDVDQRFADRDHSRSARASFRMNW
ncbi:autotransporter serine protease [Luteibacter sp. SG786]|uniref:S8 family serine peptidase n=1 Tax=Luteibacter sp. SG786 TaxID=2587130 RepID=UPI00141E06B5|nr:autotransporter-associated beta strand protein [Luteibacter sp. SG786]